MTEFTPKPTYNGVDADGKPMLFAVEDLKPFQRVVTRSATLAVVTESLDGDTTISFGNGTWELARLTDDCKEMNGNGIWRVYAAPSPAFSLDLIEYGPLIFESTASPEA